MVLFFFSSRRRHTRCSRDWSSDVCSSDLDVNRLQQVTPVYRGSYWMDASGNFGLVNGPMLGNIWALSQRSGGRREGILSTYDKTGAVVIGGRFPQPLPAETFKGAHYSPRPLHHPQVP